MYTSAALLDLHERGHRSIHDLLRHCAPFNQEELNRELPGFGYPTIRLQLAHLIDAQKYWIGVLQGRYEVDDNDAAFPTIESLEAQREVVAAITAEYLSQASDSELNTPRDLWVWPGKTRTLVPARVFVRTLTHLYQHQGQVLAMCRLLGRPGPGGLDFPLD